MTTALCVVQTFFNHGVRASEVKMPGAHISVWQSFPATSVAGDSAPVLRASERGSCAHHTGPPAAPSDLRGTESERWNLNRLADVHARKNLLGEECHCPLRDYVGRCPGRDR